MDSNTFFSLRIEFSMSLSQPDHSVFIDPENLLFQIFPLLALF